MSKKPTSASIMKALRETIDAPNFKHVAAKYYEYLEVIGNVEGDEIIALVVIAINGSDIPATNN